MQDNVNKELAPDEEEVIVYTLTDEERDLYLNFKGYEGHNYRELENGNLLIEMVKGVKERWKENRQKAKEQGKADDITPEEEKAIDDAFDSLLQED